MKMVDRKDLEALVAQQREKREPSAEVLRVDETHLKINGHAYELVTNVREGFDFAEFAQRYSTILSKYDYIVGDWGFEQLRLKGFYAADRAGAKQNQIDAVQDYLYESCNFGCAYFILHNLEVKPAPKPRRNRSRRHNGNNGPNPTNAKAEKSTTAATPKSALVVITVPGGTGPGIPGGGTIRITIVLRKSAERLPQPPNQPRP
jgi:Uncharacterized protein conserved in bacteria